MVMLDPVNAPGGRDLVQRRDVWRVRDERGRVYWAYIELRGTTPTITGYATNAVQELHNDHAAGAFWGAVVGATFGGVVGGAPGAVVGALLGLLFGVSLPAKR